MIIGQLRTSTRRTSLADAAAMGSVTDDPFELVAGQVRNMSPADASHGVLITRLLVWLVGAGHPPDRVLAGVGVRTGLDTGRHPDLVVLRRLVAGTAVWLDPIALALAVEVVSPGSRRLDRTVKPREYAEVGIPRYWLVERDGGGVEVHMRTLAVSAQIYGDVRTVGFEELLAGSPPALD